MITAGLEKLILEGKAEYVSVATGGSGVATIPFPKHAAQMFVVDFIWNPFTDIQNIIFEQDAIELNQRSIHTLLLNNGRKKSYFNFRDNIYKAADTPTLRQAPMLPPAIQINCFIESKQDIYVDIFNFANPEGVGLFYDAVPLAPSQEARTPNGYGTIRQTRSITTATAQIINMGKDRDPLAALGGNPRQRYEFFDDINNLTSLNDWTTGGAQSQHFLFPLVTFGVVIINKTQTAAGR